MLYILGWSLLGALLLFRSMAGPPKLIFRAALACFAAAAASGFGALLKVQIIVWIVAFAILVAFLEKIAGG